MKFRRPHRGHLKGKSIRGSSLAFGAFGLQAIEAGRRVISRQTKRGGKLWIRIFPDKAITARAAETRMGSGKGLPEYWVAVVKPGRIIYELSGVPETIARTSMRLAGH